MPSPATPTTGKVEFNGTLPWPSSANTEAQWRALVQRWYLAKLTDETPQAVAGTAHTMVGPALLTYMGLPIIGVLHSGNSLYHAALGYFKFKTISERAWYPFE